MAGTIDEKQDPNQERVPFPYPKKRLTDRHGFAEIADHERWVIILQFRDVHRILPRHEKPDHEFHVFLADEVGDETAQFGKDGATIRCTSAGHEVRVVEIIFPLDQSIAGIPMGNNGVDSRIVCEDFVQPGKEILLQDNRIVVKEQDIVSTASRQTEIA